LAVNLASGYARLLAVTQHSFSRTQQSRQRSVVVRAYLCSFDSFRTYVHLSEVLLHLGQNIFWMIVAQSRSFARMEPTELVWTMLAPIADVWRENRSEKSVHYIVREATSGGWVAGYIANDTEAEA
jgi:hypothetical protein